MLESLFYKNIIIYILFGVFALSMLLKFVLAIGYSRMIRASNKMGRNKNKFLRKLKLKFEKCYQLKIVVNNVDAFVDKSINNHKVLGILLITWEKFSGQIWFFSGILGLSATLLGVILEVDKMWILGVFVVGFLTSGLLMFFEGLLNGKEKKNIIRLNLIDYFENYLKNRLEQEEKGPELIEKYKNEYFSNFVIENKKILKYVAAGEEKLQEDLEEATKKTKKRSSRREERLSVRIDKKRKKEEKEATKLFKKQAKESAKLKRKENKKKRQIEAKEKTRLERLQRKEEKTRQAEIKRALNLERQILGKSKKTKKITTAQQNKENLKKEIEGFRQIEKRNKEQENMEQKDKSKDLVDISKIMNYTSERNKRVSENETKNIEISHNLEKMKKEAAVTVDKRSGLGEDKELLDKRLDESDNYKIKRNKQLSKEDKQIIEDILSEFLA